PRRSVLEKVFQEVLEYFPLDRRYIGILNQRTSLWQFATVLISRYVNAIRVAIPGREGESVVRIEANAQDEIRMLKELTWHYVILNTELATAQHGQREAVQTVFRIMLKAAQNEDTWKLFPPPYQEELSAAKGDGPLQRRIAVDYVAGLT